MQTLRQYCTVFDISVEIRQRLPTPPAFGTPVRGDAVRIAQDIRHQKTRFCRAIVWRRLGVPVFSHFSRTPTCDGQARIDTQTQGYSI